MAVLSYLVSAFAALSAEEVVSHVAFLEPFVFRSARGLSDGRVSYARTFWFGTRPSKALANSGERLDAGDVPRSEQLSISHQEALPARVLVPLPLYIRG